MARGGFPGIPGGNMQQLMRQAQKMQQQMMKAQEELDAREYEGPAAARFPARSAASASFSP